MDGNENNNIKSEIEDLKPEDKKCAPGIDFDGISCIELDILVEMVNAYNSVHPNNQIPMHSHMETLNPRKYKKYIVQQIKERVGNKCSTQDCWTKQDFVKKMKAMAKEKLESYTFRPTGPEGRFEWLNTLNINDVMKQYEQKYKDFKFLGAVPMDFDSIPSLGIKDLNFSKLMNEGKTKIGVIFNLDESWKSGSHWVAMWANLSSGEIFFGDSYAIPPEPRVRKLMRRIAKFCQTGLGIKNVRADYNRVRHQYGNSECGIFSMTYLVRFLSGETFEEICNSKITDKKVNMCRNVYFGNSKIKDEYKNDNCE